MVKADMARGRGLNPPPRYRSYPRAVKPRTHTSKYPTKKSHHHGTRHEGPPTIRLANHPRTQPAHPRAA